MLSSDRPRDDDERPEFLDAAFDDEEQRRSDAELERYRESLRGEPMRLARREAAAELRAAEQAATAREHDWVLIAGWVLVAFIVAALFIGLWRTGG